MERLLELIQAKVLHHYSPLVALIELKGVQLVAKYVARNFHQELAFAKIASSLGVGVQIYDSLYVEQCDSGMIFQEWWPCTLEQVMKSEYGKNVYLLEQIYIKLGRLLRKLHAHGIVHSDLVPRNVVCRFNGARLIGIALIDFGNSFWKTEIADLCHNLNTLTRYFFHNNWPFYLLNRELQLIPSQEQLIKHPEIFDYCLLNVLFKLANDKQFAQEFF